MSKMLLMCFWNITPHSFKKISSQDYIWVLIALHLNDYNFLPAAISGWTLPSQTTPHIIARSTPKTLLSLFWLAQLFSKPLLSLNCTTICSHHPQRINSGFHMPFEIRTLIFTNMDLISNFITFCAHQLHSHSHAFFQFESFLHSHPFFVFWHHTTAVCISFFPKAPFSSIFQCSAFIYTYTYIAKALPLLWRLPCTSTGNPNVNSCSRNYLSLLLILVHNNRLVIST